MKKSELKKIIRETILTEMVNVHPTHKTINDKLMQIAKRGVEDEKSTTIKEGEEQTYVVTYWVSKNDDEIDYDETVKATSKEDAISKVKENSPRTARKFTAKLKQ
jgi:hypothetical protein